jgi:hypothetical protein
MADLFTVKTPLSLRFPDGEKRILMEFFPHPQGLLGFEINWEQAADPSSLIRVYEGELKGEGPWKVGDAVITVLGCHGTDAELASRFADWKFQREFGAPYPEAEEIRSIALRYGATV